MTFLANGAVNRVILHTGVQSLAENAGGVFILVYLLRAGVPIPLVLGAMAAMTAGRFVLRPMVLPLAKRVGLKMTLVIGTLLDGAMFLVLPFVDGPGAVLAFAMAIASAGSVLYWTSYHAYFASIGDAEHRGGQVGAREALSATIGIAAPLLGTWAMLTGGPWLLFGGAAAIQAASVIPLLGAPRIDVVRNAPGALKAAAPGARLLLTDGWFAAGYFYVWQIGLFVTLGESYAAFGGAMALAGLAGAVSGLVVGRMIDLGHGRKAMLAACAVAAGGLLLRAAALGEPWMAVAANAAGALVLALWLPNLMTPVYNLAKASPCPLRFHIATEGAWDLGCGVGCLAAALIAAAGMPLAYAMLLGLVGVGAAGVLITRGYGSSALAT
jgi:DHA1 family inner membrane transport protein